MVNFNEFKSILESGLPFGDNQDTRGIVNSFGPVLKERIKKLVIELSAELSGDQPFPRHQLDAAARQALLDLADSHEPLA